MMIGIGLEQQDKWMVVIILDESIEVVCLCSVILMFLSSVVWLMF